MSGNTVLIIDDAPDMHELLKARLAPEGLALHHAFTSEEGLRLAQKARPSLILLDLGLTDPGGFQLCRRLKADPLTAQTPIIMLTADQDVDSKVRALDLGAVDYVTTPFEGTELRARVRAALREKRSQDLLAARTQADTLAGPPDRAQLERRLREEVAATRRYGRQLSLLLVELEGARLRAAGGAPLLRQAMTTLGEWLPPRLRTSDVIFRYDEESFAVVLPETDLAGARHVEGRLRAYPGAVEAIALWHRGERLALTVRTGVSASEQLRDGTLTYQALLALAEEAKARGPAGVFAESPAPPA